MSPGVPPGYDPGPRRVVTAPTTPQPSDQLTNPRPEAPSGAARERALAAQGLRLSVWPPTEDGGKRPLPQPIPADCTHPACQPMLAKGRPNGWTHGQHTAATAEQVDRWYSNGRRGLGVIGGEVSDGLEVFDFDDWDTYEAYMIAADKVGLGDVLERIHAGYSERTPNDGVHMLYRCERVDGNTKLARRTKRPDEMADENDTVKVLIETRGKGGYVITAPSEGPVHPTGKPYVVMRGGFETIAKITPDEREDLWDLARTFDQLVRKQEPIGERRSTYKNRDRSDEVPPGDDYNARTSWTDILEPAGWTYQFTAADDNQHWCRPAKKAGTSATVSKDGDGVLYVFSSSTEFESETAYSKFGAYAALNHAGNFEAAAKQLYQDGYGTRHERNHTKDSDRSRTGETDPPEIFEFFTAAELAHRVDNDPPVGYLCRPVWPADAYGVLAAEHKAGKTWADLDMAVSVASGTPWLDTYPVERSGRVLIFLGEGGKRKMLRRFRAVCEAKGVRFEDLPIDLCFRVPHLSSDIHLGIIGEKIDGGGPVLVIIDPMYLAAQGAKSSSLFDMGTHLERLQIIVQKANAALAIVHHWNQTGTGKGAERMSGAGPAEWGRVLVSVAVESRHTDNTTKASSVVLGWTFIGDEIPDTELRIRRHVWTDDPDDLGAPMHYRIERLENRTTASSGNDGMPPATRRVLAALRKATTSVTVHDIGDLVVVDDTGGPPLKARTIQASLKALSEAGLAESEIADGRTNMWRPAVGADQ